MSAVSVSGEHPAVSVVIPTYNRSETVCDCVESVLAQKDAELEVVVVDDCSQEDVRGALKKRFGGDPRVRCVRNSRNMLVAASRNAGAEASSGGYLLFLDNDNILEPGAVAQMLACFGRHPDAGLVAPLSVHQRGDGGGMIWTLGSDFNRWTSQPRDTHPDMTLDRLPPEPVDWPTTYSPNAFMVPRNVFDEVGGFDVGYGMMFEESDFGWRIVETGRSAWITSRARTKHFGLVDPGCNPQLRRLGIERPNRTLCFARNRLRFARRHFNLLQILSVSLVFAPISAVCYCSVALKNRRPDIAWAYLRGTVSGILGL